MSSWKIATADDVTTVNMTAATACSCGAVCDCLRPPNRDRDAMTVTVYATSDYVSPVEWLPVTGERRPDPVRPRPLLAGRNDPCPCGSGRKYKRCCRP